MLSAALSLNVPNLAEHSPVAPFWGSLPPSLTQEDFDNDGYLSMSDLRSACEKYKSLGFRNGASARRAWLGALGFGLFQGSARFVEVGWPTKTQGQPDIFFWWVSRNKKGGAADFGVPLETLLSPDGHLQIGVDINMCTVLVRACFVY